MPQKAKKRRSRTPRRGMTPKQREVYRWFYKRRASIRQIAQWLNITPRAVMYRLQNARKHQRRQRLKQPRPPEKGLVITASQISRGKFDFETI